MYYLVHVEGSSQPASKVYGYEASKKTALKLLAPMLRAGYSYSFTPMRKGFSTCYVVNTTRERTIHHATITSVATKV